MTIVVLLANPPRTGLVGTELAASSPLSPAEAASLYEALFRDAVLAVERSGGDLLVNYPPAGDLPPDHRTDTSPETELHAIVADTLDDADGVRFEPQVGSTFDARAGNTVTHLLREEGADSVAVVTPSAPLLSRTVIDAAAMKLRSNGVVLGPSPRGRTVFAGFTAPIDFDGAFAAPSVTTLTERGRDAGLDVDFVATQPSLEAGADLLDVVPILRARVAAERVVPEHLATFIHEHGLSVSQTGEDLQLVRTD